MSLHFLPHLRHGIAAGLAGTPGEATSVTLSATVTAHQSEGDPDEVALTPTTMALLGPGHIAALTPTAIRVQDPRPGALDVEPNRFAAVELAPADLPWRFTPGGADAEGHLRPWLVLVVVQQIDGNRLSRVPGRRLPELLVADAATELPRLDQSWAWAHVQVDTAAAAGLDDPDDHEALRDALVGDSPGLTARLLCPRRLEPGARWWACLVPAFEAGRRAGLGQGGGGSADDAWTDGEVLLPVYASWEFSTSAPGDFESLVRRLRPTEFGPDVGTTTLGVSAAGLGAAGVSADVQTPYLGALVSPAALQDIAEHDARPPPAEAALGEALRTEVNATVVTDPPGAGGGPAGDEDPVVGLPAYGHLHADMLGIPPPTRRPNWYAQVNTHPRHRAVAGIGAEAVRAAQEELVDQAWDAVGQVDEANRAVRASQLALQVNRVARARLTSGAAADAVRMAAPALHAIHGDGQPTIGAQLHTSGVPDGLLSGAFHQLTAGPHGLGGGDSAHPASALVGSFLEDPNNATGAFRDAVAPVGQTGQHTTEPTVTAPIGPGDGGTVILHHPNVQKRDRDPHLNKVDVSRVGDLVHEATDPDAMMRRSLAHRVPGLDTADGIPDRLTVTPQFTQPAVDAVRRHSPDLLVPGLSGHATDIVGLLVVNEAFIEALLAGMNHEMAREFRWREFPTPLHSTWFRQFWATPTPDIPAMAEWSPAGRLGQQNGTDQPDVVLIIRGQLPRRYPQMRLYLTPARWTQVKTEDGQIHDMREEDPEGPPIELPRFAAALGEDTFAFGFDLDAVTITGDPDPGADRPGWFFVFEEPAGAPRFGLEARGVTPAGAPEPLGQAPVDWSTISWAAVTPPDAGVMVRHVDVTATPWMVDGIARQSNGPDADVWADDAAAVARQTLQRPIRVLLHADAVVADGPLATRSRR